MTAIAHAGQGAPGRLHAVSGALLTFQTLRRHQALQRRVVSFTDSQRPPRPGQSVRVEPNHISHLRASKRPSVSVEVNTNG